MRIGTPSINQADVIIRIRKASGLTQQEFADKLGVDRGMIANIERGFVQNPRLALLPLLVEEMNVNPYCLIREGEALFLESVQSKPSGLAQKEYEGQLLSARSKAHELVKLLDGIPVVK